MMLLAEQDVATLPRHVALSTDAAILSAVLSPAINLAIWERRLSSDLANVIAGEDWTRLGAVRLTGQVSELSCLLVDGLAAKGISASGASMLAEDITALARCCATVMDGETLDVRLEMITGNSCRKFHADYVTARLITTYCGRATEWIDAVEAERFAAIGAVSSEAIRRLKVGEVALFKGRFWSPDDAIIHRSPPIEGTGEVRLLLVINPKSG
jgi:hypothetical protein